MSLQSCMHTGVIEAGCDEAGRGCLCGPVVCAAVILPRGYSNPELDDSKRLTARRREALREVIIRDAVTWAVVEVGPEEIDRINILNASIEGMRRALDALDIVPEHVLVDGNRFKPWRDVPYTTVVHGDATYMSIAAASILAKTHRDALMKRLAGEYPGYGWERNMGYPTAEHVAALHRLGLTPHHRRSYAPCQPSLFDL